MSKCLSCKESTHLGCFLRLEPETCGTNYTYEPGSDSGVESEDLGRLVGQPDQTSCRKDTSND